MELCLRGREEEAGPPQEEVVCSRGPAASSYMVPEVAGNRASGLLGSQNLGFWHIAFSETEESLDSK